MKLLDGRDSFSQWDLNVKVTSNKFKVGDEIHFYNIRQPNALPVKAYLLDGKVVAEVPNILLQSAYPIFAYCMVDDAGATYTIKKYEFKVKQRPKPDDYVYTQTEVKTYDALVERMDEIEKNGVSDERIGQAVSEYLMDNPIDLSDGIQLTDKATGKNYVLYVHNGKLTMAESEE